MSDTLFAEKTEPPRALLAESYAVMDEAEDEHKPVARWALFSGGHDSLTAVSVAMEWARERRLEMRVGHINTGIGIPDTREFVRETCDREGWPLREFAAPVPYEEIVVEHGFPGPASHGLMYARLKERALRQLVRESKREFADRVMLVTGVRSEESLRRMRHVDRIQRDGAQVWTAAIWNWSKLDCGKEIARRGLKRNEVVDKIHMSGECLCGAFAKPGEIKELEVWFPEVADRLHELELRVEAAGHPACRWGLRPPRVNRHQLNLMAPGPLCVGCGGDEEAA